MSHKSKNDILYDELLQANQDSYSSFYTALMDNAGDFELVNCEDFSEAKAVSDNVSFLCLFLDMGGEYNIVMYSFHRKKDLVKDLRYTFSEENTKEILKCIDIKKDRSVSRLKMNDAVYGLQDLVVAVLV